jgi:(p)ppGpp synthase/HD superfamily hydrolase
MNLVDRARVFATRAHAGQQRKYTGESYIVHPTRVARNVAAAGGDEAMVAAAYLHDTIEDTPVTYFDLVDAFGLDVAGLVLELTHVYTPEAYPEINRAQRKQLEAARLATVSKRAKLIKLFDVLDNLPSVCQHDPGFAKVYVPEQQAVLQAVTS